MAREWQKRLAIIGLAFIFSLTAACGGEEPVDEQENSEECNPDVEECPDEECIPGVDPECPLPCAADDFDTTEEFDACLCDAGLNDYCVEEVQGCQSDNDCSGNTPYCYEDDNTCVSSNFICTLLNCSGQPGVCDPENRACINAEFCTSTNDCLDDYLCVENSCQLEAEVCDCPIDFECIYDRNTLTATCERINQVCEPSSRICSPNGDLLACNSEGTAVNTLECLNGCDQGEDSSDSSTTGRCNRPLGDECTAPLEITPGSSYEINWSDYDNDITPGVLTSCVNSSTQPRTAGPEAFFAVTVPAGEVLTVDMTTSTDYGFFYILNDCPENVPSCTNPGGQIVSQENGQFTRTVWHTNDTADDEVVLLVADTSNAASGSASFSFDSAPSICTPGARLCTENQLEACNPQGTGYVDLFPCELGCNDTLTGCTTYPHNECPNALDLREEEGQSFTGRIVDFFGEGGEFDAEDACESADGNTTTYAGNTAFFSMDLIAGERVVANLASSFDAALWMADGCLAAQGQCLAAINQNSQSEQLIFQADEAGTYYLAVQAVGDDLDETGVFTVDISIDLPICEDQDAGTVLGCFDDNLIGYCTGNSDFPSFYGCDGACNDGQCVEPSGDRCLDPIVAESGTTYTGSFADQSFMLTSPNASCLGTGIVSRANDTIYEVTLEEGQILNAELLSGSPSTGLYLLTDCPVTGATNSFCEASSFPTKTLNLYKEDGGTFYLVVASTNGAESSAFDLNIEITDGICLPGSTVCSEGVTSLCNELGDELTPIETCAGACGETQCAGFGDTNDFCENAVVISEDSVVRDSFESYFGSLPFQSGVCGLPQDTALQGGDAFYTIELDNREGFHATLTTDADAALVLLEGCSQNSCVRTQLASSNDALSFYAPNGGTYTLIAKAVNGSDDDDFELSIEFFDGDCDPATDNACMVENGMDLASQCTELGELIQVECDFGCTDGVCNDRPGSFCPSAFDIDTEGTFDEVEKTISYSYSGSLTGFSASYSPVDPTTGASCTGWFGDGPDVVFSFLGWNGDTVSVDLNTTYDGAIWITSDCTAADGATSCVAGSDNTFGVGFETLTYNITETKMYYIMADAVQAGASGTLDVDVTINVGPRLVEPTINVVDAPTELTGTVNNSTAATFTIENLGDVDLDYTITTDDSDLLAFDIVASTVAGESFEAVELTATCPNVPGTYMASYTISSNDTANPEVTVDVALSCFELPGSLLINITGLPADENPGITVTGDNFSQFLIVNYEITELLPGDYTITPNTVAPGGTIYSAPPQTITVGSEQDVIVTVEYEAQ